MIASLLHSLHCLQNISYGIHSLNLSKHFVEAFDLTAIKSVDAAIDIMLAFK